MNSSRIALMWFMLTFTGALLAAGFLGHEPGVAAEDPQPALMSVPSSATLASAWESSLYYGRYELQRQPPVMFPLPSVYLDPRRAGPIDCWSPSRVSGVNRSQSAPKTQPSVNEPAKHVHQEGEKPLGGRAVFSSHAPGDSVTTTHSPTPPAKSIEASQPSRSAPTRRAGWSKSSRRWSRSRSHR